jgi:SHS2 domain-containing protein
MVAYRLLDHTADLGFECEARTLEALFSGAILALADIIAHIEPLTPAESVEIEAHGADDAARLRALLDEVLFQFETKAFLPKEAKVRLEGDHARATLLGQKVDLTTHPIERVVKAVTYHGLSVEKTKKKGFSARVILDL